MNTIDLIETAEQIKGLPVDSELIDATGGTWYKPNRSTLTLNGQHGVWLLSNARDMDAVLSCGPFRLASCPESAAFADWMGAGLGVDSRLTPDGWTHASVGGSKTVPAYILDRALCPRCGNEGTLKHEGVLDGCPDCPAGREVIKQLAEIARRAVQAGTASPAMYERAGGDEDADPDLTDAVIWAGGCPS